MRSLTTIAGVAVLIVGCADTNERDMSGLEREIQQAKAGDFGECLEELARAAAQLDEAEATLAEGKRWGWLAEAEHAEGMAAATKAVEHRRNAERACTTRVAMVEKDVSTVGGRVGDLEQTREVLRGVTFERDSAVLTTQAKTVLDLVANKLIRQPRKVEIAGHTSNTGSAEHNMTLSQQRAEAVRDHLIRKGVPKDNLAAKGYGMTKPIASNDTEEGRRANKRVELHYM